MNSHLIHVGINVDVLHKLPPITIFTVYSHTFTLLIDKDLNECKNVPLFFYPLLYISFICRLLHVFSKSYSILFLIL
jgi:hypothetical protein